MAVTERPPESTGWPDGDAVAAEIERLQTLADRHLPDPCKIDVDVWDNTRFDATAIHYRGDDSKEGIVLIDGEYRYRNIVDGEQVEDRVIDPP